MRKKFDANKTATIKFKAYQNRRTEIPENRK